MLHSFDQLPHGAIQRSGNAGLFPALDKWGARVGVKSGYFRHDGSAIASVQVTDSSGWNATYGMHRADFVNFLASSLRRRGGE